MDTYMWRDMEVKGYQTVRQKDRFTNHLESFSPLKDPLMISCDQCWLDVLLPPVILLLEIIFNEKILWLANQKTDSGDVNGAEKQ